MSLSDQWKNMSKALIGAGHALVAVQDNLIDAIWMDRPERPSTQLRTLGLDYTGQCWHHHDTGGCFTVVKHNSDIVVILELIDYLRAIRKIALN